MLRLPGAAGKGTAGDGKLSRRSDPEAMTRGTQNEITDLERCILSVESALIVLSIAAIAAADRFVAPSASLGFLYLIPMSDSALTHRWDLGNMVQFKADFEKEYCAARDLGSSRSLNPQLQTFAQWLAANKERIPLG